MAAVLDADTCQEFFTQCDLNGNGNIDTYKELKDLATKLIAHMGLEVQAEQLNTEVNGYAVSKDHSMDLATFMRWFSVKFGAVHPLQASDLRLKPSDDLGESELYRVSLDGTIWWRIPASLAWEGSPDWVHIGEGQAVGAYGRHVIAIGHDGALHKWHYGHPNDWRPIGPKGAQCIEALLITRNRVLCIEAGDHLVKEWTGVGEQWVVVCSGVMGGLGGHTDSALFIGPEHRKVLQNDTPQSTESVQLGDLGGVVIEHVVHTKQRTAVAGRDGNQDVVLEWMSSGSVGEGEWKPIGSQKFQQFCGFGSNIFGVTEDGAVWNNHSLAEGWQQIGEGCTGALHIAGAHLYCLKEDHTVWLFHGNWHQKWEQVADDTKSMCGIYGYGGCPHAHVQC